MFSAIGKIAVRRWIVACALFVVGGPCLAQTEPYELTFQALIGAGQTHVSIAISAAPGFALPTAADKVLVRSLDATGTETLRRNYFDVPLAGGQATVVFPEVAADALVSVQVNFKTPDAAKTRVLRADSFVVSQIDVAIDTVSAPSTVNECPGSTVNTTGDCTPYTFNVIVTVSELSGSGGAQFGVEIVSPDQSVLVVVGSVSGLSIPAGGTMNVVVPTYVSIHGNNALKTFAAVLTNITPTDAIAGNNSVDFTIFVLCSFEDVDCGN